MAFEEVAGVYEEYSEFRKLLGSLMCLTHTLADLMFRV